MNVMNTMTQKVSSKETLIKAFPAPDLRCESA